MELTTNVNVTGTTRQLFRWALSTEVFGGACIVLVCSNRTLLFNIRSKPYYEKQSIADNRLGTPTIIELDYMLKSIETMAT